MHELSIAQSLLDIVLEEARKHGVRAVHTVAVKVGVFSGVVPSSLQFSFDLIKEGTLAAGAELVVEKVPALGRCQECGAGIDMSEPVLDCPLCGSEKVKLEPGAGQELYIDHLEAD
ncbi:MAG: hydrogenase maturation nickel metallochaperone HypA [Deltaproteobacteria bacterium]|nr:hydrogenase maturation nickel metallochaperone HypA [Deltaproteobacteria bacterium]